MKENKFLQFLQRHIKPFIALLVVVSILLSLIGAVPVIAMIREKLAQLQQDPTATTAPTTPTTEPTIPDDEEKIKEAIVILTEKLESTKNQPSLYANRAALYYHLEKYDEAIADYTSALELYEDPQTYYLRAVVYSVAGSDRKAYWDLTKALKAQPDNTDYLSLMADTCVTLKKHAMARECLEKLLKTDEKNAILSTLAGDACINLEDYPGAVEHYRKALANFTKATEEAGIVKSSLFSAYANALKMSEKYAEAVQAYADSLALKENKELYFQKGYCLLQLEKYDEAAADFTKCVELGYEVAISRFQRALCYYVSLRYEAAIEDFQAYEAAYPDKEDAYLYLGLCYQSLKQYDSAIRYLQKSIEANISVGDCSFNIGNCYYNLGNYESAVPYYTTAIDQNAQLYSALLNRGNAYVKLNKYNEAKADLKRVIDECTNADLVKSAQTSYDPIKNITIVTKK